MKFNLIFIRRIIFNMTISKPFFGSKYTCWFFYLTPLEVSHNKTFLMKKIPRQNGINQIKWKIFHKILFFTWAYNSRKTIFSLLESTLRKFRIDRFEAELSKNEPNWPSQINFIYTYSTWLPVPPCKTDTLKPDLLSRMSNYSQIRTLYYPHIYPHKYQK